MNNLKYIYTVQIQTAPHAVCIWSAGNQIPARGNKTRCEQLATM